MLDVNNENLSSESTEKKASEEIKKSPVESAENEELKGESGDDIKEDIKEDLPDLSDGSSHLSDNSFASEIDENNNDSSNYLKLGAAALVAVAAAGVGVNAVAWLDILQPAGNYE